jgi:hypothetical protein
VITEIKTVFLMQIFNTTCFSCRVNTSLTVLGTCHLYYKFNNVHNICRTSSWRLTSSVIYNFSLTYSYKLREKKGGGGVPGFKLMPIPGIFYFFGHQLMTFIICTLIPLWSALNRSDRLIKSISFTPSTFLSQDFWQSFSIRHHRELRFCLKIVQTCYYISTTGSYARCSWNKNL